MCAITQSLIIQISSCLVIISVATSHVMVVVVCLSSSQSQELVLFDIINPSGQLRNDMFKIFNGTASNTFNTYVL